MAVDHEDADTLAILDASPVDQAIALARLGLRPAVIQVLVNSCENRCFFCANPETLAVPRERFTPWERIRDRLAARPQGVDTLLVGGNEPALHPDFERLLAHARGFDRVEVMTSGLRIGDDWGDRGVTAVAVPLYGDAAIHDAVVGSTAWARTVDGLDRARRAGIEVLVHTIALRRNLGGLGELARLVLDRWGTRLSVAPLREKADVFRYDDEAVSLVDLARALEGLPVRALGVPRCVARELPRGGSEIIEVYFRSQRRGYASPCEGCAARAGCPGVVAAELARRGAEGLSALG